MAARGAKPARVDQEDDAEGTEAVLVSEVIPATRERVFTAWMSSEQHSAFTGEEAVIEPVVGGSHSSMAGYAQGTTLVLEQNRRIVQSWRAREFPADCADSTVEITLEETVGGTLVTLLHSQIPRGQSDRCREAWLRSYLEPLKRYFTGRVSNGVHAADTQALRGRRKRPTAAASEVRGRGRKTAGKRRTKGKAAVKPKPARRTGAKAKAGARPGARKRGRTATGRAATGSTAAKPRPPRKKPARKPASSTPRPRKGPGKRR
jgi:uncharacterized protein YndB with AHSA1/START domain